MAAADRRKCDVLVVGASASGASMAYELAVKGLDVLLVDRRDEAETKVCGGGLTRKCESVSWFEREKKHFTLRESREHHFIFEGAARKMVVSNYMIHQTKRRILDAHLRKMAVDAGARLVKDEFTSYSVNGSEPVKASLKVRGSVEARLLAGCDGITSRVRECALPGNPGLAPRRPRRGYAAAGEVPFGREFSETYWFTNADRTGYCWLLPKDDCVNVGVARTENGTVEKPMAELKRVMEHCVKEGLIKADPEEFMRRELKFAALPRCGPSRVMHDEGMILAGDASFAVEPFTGEGLSYAFMQSAIAARVAGDLASGPGVKGDGSRNRLARSDLARYTIECREEFGRGLELLCRAKKRGLLDLVFDLIEKMPGAITATAWLGETLGRMPMNSDGSRLKVSVEPA